jgi:hypothetical protein
MAAQEAVADDARCSSGTVDLAAVLDLTVAADLTTGIARPRR